jgi:hypothetical protein
MRYEAASAIVRSERRDEMSPVVAANDAPTCLAVMRRGLGKKRMRPLVVYGVDLPTTSPNHPFGRETFTRREDAERFIEDVRGDAPEVAAKLRIEKRELQAGGSR